MDAPSSSLAEGLVDETRGAPFPLPGSPARCGFSPAFLLGELSSIRRPSVGARLVVRDECPQRRAGRALVLRGPGWRTRTSVGLSPSMARGSPSEQVPGHGGRRGHASGQQGGGGDGVGAAGRVPEHSKPADAQGVRDTGSVIGPLGRWCGRAWSERPRPGRSGQTMLMPRSRAAECRNSCPSLLAGVPWATRTGIPPATPCRARPTRRPSARRMVSSFTTAVTAPPHRYMRRPAMERITDQRP